MKVSWGIIGVGDVTEVKSGPAFNKVQNSEIKMVMRRNRDKAQDYAWRHGIANFTTVADYIINHPAINAVYIATPPSSHAEYTIRAARAKKHVYVEKPMATSHAECQQMIRACRENDVKLFVAFYRRELDYFKKIKELIAEKVIGDVKAVSITLLWPPNKADFDKSNLPWRVKADIAGAGYFYDLASHQFDFLDYLFGPVKSAKGQATNQLGLYDVEDIVTASFMFESNIVGSGTWCFTVDETNRADRTEILGSKGKITFSFFAPTPIEISTHGSTETVAIDYPRHVQQPLIDSVVKDILGSAVCVSSGESAARSNWVMEQIIKPA